MRADRIVLGLALAATAALGGCMAAGEAEEPINEGPVVKGGDMRNGAYDAPTVFWKPHPEADRGYGYAQVSGAVADSPDRIIVGIRGDRTPEGRERPNSTNWIVEVNGQGDITKRWTQWDTMVGFPHQLYISPYDPQRHIWVVDRGGSLKTVHEQILKFTNDGSQLVMRLRDPAPTAGQGGPNPRENPNPGPYDYGQASTMAFFPNGDFLVADGYQNGRIIRYNAQGELISEFGKVDMTPEVGGEPGSFDLIHGVAIDREHRIYVADRNNDRIQVFTEDGTFIEEWPNVLDPVGIYIDEREGVWVVSAVLNRILKYNLQGELQHFFGAYGGTRGGFPGGLARPHQMTVDPAGNLYIASYDGPWLNKFTPKPGADPSQIVGQPLLLEN